MPVPKRRINWCIRSPWGQRKFRKMSAPNDATLEAGQEQKPLRLLLSSYGFNTPIMREKYAKVISQGDDLCEKTCLIVPYAGFDVEKTFEREKHGLVSFGFAPQNIVFVKSRFDIVHSFPDYIYVPGGDPFKLLNTIREIEILHDIVECVKDKRAVYIGVSAGADIATKSIEYVMQLEDNNVIRDNRFDALCLINESILCHYDHYSYSTIKECQEVSNNAIIPINDDQLVSFENGKWEYV